MNKRITPRERGLLKGAIRRVFARSELRKQVLMAAIVEFSDPLRTRVKTWVQCAICGGLEAKSYAVVDHIDPVIPVNKSFEEMSLDEVVDRMWCSIDNLQIVCETCHSIKTKEENKQRKKIKLK
jgi:5-methylcytosine-specific restriction endonuclease McrA